jgi:hypothetical protein
VFANKLKRSVGYSQRGVADFVKQQLAGFKDGPQDEYAFRPINRPVFQQQAAWPQEDVTVPDVAYAAAPPLKFEILPDVDEAPVAPQQPYMAVDDVPLAIRMTAMDWQRRQQQLVAKINAQSMPEHHVAAHVIVPVDLFVGDLGRFLMMACDFYSHSFSNTVLLPKHMESARGLGLPTQFGISQELQKSDAQIRISQLRARVMSEHNRVASALSRGDVSALFKEKSTRLDYKQELAGICRSLATNAIGLSAFMSHESRYGTWLRNAGV